MMQGDQPIINGINEIVDVRQRGDDREYYVRYLCRSSR